ncbi:hypothetical protein An05g00710 [Aspergillus niger]|uniref:Uncharacterized protein n=2 Tax=Aspergillus niger TaxID=5061 RepID=A2QKM5_ASPNC|nr:hypothetical protein An05g00710 [Aspergillus niger]CAK39108.1 hypothetical protein An05g00710 [Aspergillus niger]
MGSEDVTATRRTARGRMTSHAHRTVKIILLRLLLLWGTVSESNVCGDLAHASTTHLMASDDPSGLFLSLFKPIEPEEARGRIQEQYYEITPCNKTMWAGWTQHQKLGVKAQEDRLRMGAFRIIVETLIFRKESKGIASPQAPEQPVDLRATARSQRANMVDRCMSKTLCHTSAVRVANNDPRVGGSPNTQQTTFSLGHRFSPVKETDCERLHLRCTADSEVKNENAAAAIRNPVPLILEVSKSPANPSYTWIRGTDISGTTDQVQVNNMDLMTDCHTKQAKKESVYIVRRWIIRIGRDGLLRKSESE